MLINHAIVGCGRVAQAHAEAFARLAGVQLRCAMDPHAERAERLAGQFPFDHVSTRFADLLADPHLTSLSLTVPHDVHAPLALDAVRAGKHVLVEKPFALDAAEGRRLLDEGNRAGVTVMPVAQHRFDPLVRVVRDLVASGALGTLSLVRGHLECVRPLAYYADSSWRGQLAREGGSVLINQAYHIVDLLLWLVGPLVRASAHMDARKLGTLVETEDTLAASLVFEQGALGVLSVTGATGKPWASYLEIGGTNGLVAFDIDGPTRLRRLELNDAARQQRFEAAFADASARDTEPGAAAVYYGSSHRHQAQAFVEAVRGHDPAEACTADDALAVVEVIQAIYASARASAPVSIAVSGLRAAAADRAALQHAADASHEQPDETPAAWQDVRDEDIEAVALLLRGGALQAIGGGLLDNFEHDFAAFAGTSHCVGCCNGTAAIHAALFAAGVRAGDEVLICDYAFHGAAAAILRLGARLVPVDCLPDSLTMDPDDLRRARRRRAKAVLVHNPWGVPADFAALREAAGDLPIVSDASHAHGASYRQRPIAHWADITCFSLGVGKLITGGELGAAATDNAHYRDQMLIYGHVNRVPHALIDRTWTGNAIGLKLRPHVIAMTLARAQIKRYGRKKALLVDTCRRIEAALAEAGLRPQQPPAGAERVYWKIVCRADEELFAPDGAAITAALHAAGVPVEPNDYWPLLQQHSLLSWPEYASLLRRRRCPAATRVTPSTIKFPAPVVLPAGMWPPLLAAVHNGLEPLRRTISAASASR
jgi:predicted dehydrogenase/dTDP-4-amino-4,6-dideoxygalactose transaminase